MKAKQKQNIRRLGLAVVLIMTMAALTVSLTSCFCSHRWMDISVVKEATCEEAGVSKQQCIECGKTRKRADIRAKGHTYGEWTIEKEATCSETGAKSAVCFVCEKKTYETIPTLEHVISESVIVKPATCTDAGESVTKCLNCDEIFETTSIDPLGHNYEWVMEVVATCQQEGKNVGTCTHDSTHTTITTLPKTEHVYEWVTDVESTCQQEGRKLGTCTLAGCTATITASIPKKPHAIATLSAIPPTCVAPGKTEGQYCINCEFIIQAQQTLSPTGHYDNDDDLQCDTCPEYVLNDVIYIYTASDLEKIRGDLNGIYVQMANIDLKGSTFAPIGTEDKPFSGKYYGNGYYIKNFKLGLITDTGKKRGYMSMFVKVSEATIDSLWLSDVSASFSGTLINVDYCQLFASPIACMASNSKFSHCKVENVTCNLSQSAKVEGFLHASRVVQTNFGGICAFADSTEGTIIQNCFINNMEASFALRGVEGYWGGGGERLLAGGLIGESYGGITVENCYVKGTITPSLNGAGDSKGFVGDFIGLVSELKYNGQEHDADIRNSLGDISVSVANDNKKYYVSNVAGFNSNSADIGRLADYISNVYYVAGNASSLSASADAFAIRQAPADINYLHLLYNDLQWDPVYWRYTGTSVNMNTVQRVK